MTFRRLSNLSVFAAFLSTFFLISAITAYSDSLELRDGRHLRGKYVGGTSTDISFMTDGVVQRIAVSDVLLLVFGDTNVEAPLGISSQVAPASRSLLKRAGRRTPSANTEASPALEHHSDQRHRPQSPLSKTNVAGKAPLSTAPLKTI